MTDKPNNIDSEASACYDDYDYSDMSYDSTEESQNMSFDDFSDYAVRSCDLAVSTWEENEKWYDDGESCYEDLEMSFDETALSLITLETSEDLNSSPTSLLGEKPSKLELISRILMLNPGVRLGRYLAEKGLECLEESSHEEVVTQAENETGLIEGAKEFLDDLIEEVAPEEWTVEGVSDALSRGLGHIFQEETKDKEGNASVASVELSYDEEAFDYEDDAYLFDDEMCVDESLDNCEEELVDNDVAIGETVVEEDVPAVLSANQQIAPMAMADYGAKQTSTVYRSHHRSSKKEDKETEETGRGEGQAKVSAKSTQATDNAVALYVDSAEDAVVSTERTGFSDETSGVNQDAVEVYEVQGSDTQVAELGTGSVSQVVGGVDAEEEEQEIVNAYSITSTQEFDANNIEVVSIQNLASEIEQENLVGAVAGIQNQRLDPYAYASSEFAERSQEPGFVHGEPQVVLGEEVVVEDSGDEERRERVGGVAYFLSALPFAQGFSSSQKAAEQSNRGTDTNDKMFDKQVFIPSGLLACFTDSNSQSKQRALRAICESLQARMFTRVSGNSGFDQGMEHGQYQPPKIIEEELIEEDVFVQAEVIYENPASLTAPIPSVPVDTVLT